MRQASLDIAADACSAERQTDGIGPGDALDAGRSDGHAEARADQSQHGEPLRRLLNDARAEAVLFAERRGLFIGEMSGVGREQDERLVPQRGGGKRLAMCQGVACRHDGDEGFGEESLDLEALDRAAVAQECNIDRAVQQGVGHS